MRETMLHLDTALTESERERLCSNLQGEGVTCDAANSSLKPHLLFVAYDESRTAPHDLVRIAADTGLAAQVVDL